MIATAIVAAIADGKALRNGRQLAAWLGLVPRQHSSGDKQRLLGISKRGDPYLRTLLIHGARSVVYRCVKKTDSRSRWIATNRGFRNHESMCGGSKQERADNLGTLLARTSRTAAQLENPS